MTGPVKRYEFFAYIDDDVAELDCHEADDGTWINAADYDRDIRECIAAGILMQDERYAALEAEHENLRLSWGLLWSENNALRQQRDKLAGLLREEFPRVDPDKPIPLDEVKHCCEYVLYQERERLHRLIDAKLASLKGVEE